MEYLDWKAGGRGPAGMGVFSEIMMVSIFVCCALAFVCFSRFRCFRLAAFLMISLYSAFTTYFITQHALDPLFFLADCSDASSLSWIKIKSHKV